MVRPAAETAFAACGCRDYARVDFILRGNDELYLLEINTLPGMKETSLLPMSARCAGLDFTALVKEMISPALAAFSGGSCACFFVSRSDSNTPNSRSWRDIPQQVKPRSMSVEGRRRLAWNGFKTVMATAIVAGLGWGGYQIASALRGAPKAVFRRGASGTRCGRWC